MSLRLKKSLASILLFSSALPLVALILYSNPIPVEAQTTDCAAVIGGVIAGFVATFVGSSATAVPNESKGSDVTGASTAGSAYGTFFGDCVVKPLVIDMAQRILANITNSLVTWIQNGFNGNPSFVTNIDDLVSNSANQGIGEFLNSTALGKYLCQPFATQVRIALATSFSQQQYAGCTLTQIDQNIQNIGASQQAWQSWINISTVPANNQYGAYVQASGILNDLLSTQIANINNQVNRNGGFLDYQVCDTYGPSNGVTPTASNPFGIDTSITAQPVTQNSSNPFAVNSTAVGSLPANTTDSWGVNTSLVSFPNQGSTQTCIHSHTTTPGQTISNALAGKYSSEFNQIGVAQDINQIMGALINEMVSQTLTGAGGLLGGSTQTVNNTQSLSATVTASSTSDADSVNTLNSNINNASNNLNTNITNASQTNNNPTGTVSFVGTLSNGSPILSKSANTTNTYSLVISPTSSSTVISTPVSATITLTSATGATANSTFSSASISRMVNGQSVSLEQNGSLLNTGTLSVDNLPVPVEIDLSLKPNTSAVLGTNFNFTVTLTDANGATLGSNTETFTIIP